jgi:hypothetical protein
MIFSSWLGSRHPIMQILVYIFDTYTVCEGNPDQYMYFAIVLILNM